MGRGKKRAAPAVAGRQVQLERLPLLKKPLEQLGKYIKVPGSFWEGRQSSAEKASLYKCLVREHSAMATFAHGHKAEGFQLQEMGVAGTGSLEHGDASGEIFWMEYPFPFLTYFYDTYPELKPDAPERTPAAPANVVDLDDDADAPTSPDVLPSFPHLRLSKAPVMSCFSILSDILQDAGPKTGQFAAKFQCELVEADGRSCGKTRVILHKRGRAVSTTNLISHIRERAAVCAVHKGALAKIEAASTNFIELDGETVAVHTFRDAFPHHVDLMWLQAIGLSFTMTKRAEFRGYARGYEPRAAFPDHGTQHKLVDVTHALQTRARVRKISLKKKLYMGHAWCGLQIDMWWDPDTQTCFACISMTTVEEPVMQSLSAQLWLASEIMAFEVFPYHAKTGELIKCWVTTTLAKNGLTHEEVSGVAPDGAADGQCGFRLIPTLGEKVDTCLLHVLQRGVLNSLGLAGVTSKNPHARGTLKKNNRVVTLSRQSGSFGKSITEPQLAAGVPAHKVLTPEPTSTTRWGNQFQQVSKNCTLRPAIDPGLEKYKKENKGKKEAIVETNESEQGSKVGEAVAASEIGLAPEDWEDTQEVEAFLSYPFDIKETIEKRPYCTGAQGLALLYDLKSNFCNSKRTLSVKALPAGLTLADRERVTEDKDADDLGLSVITARMVLQRELQERAFDLRPSNTRLVQCYMSKQVPASAYLTSAQVALGKTLYLEMLRTALEISRSVPKRSSPPRAAKKPKLAAGGMLFRGTTGLAGDDSSPATPAAPDDAEFDPVVDEMRRWEALSADQYSAFVAEDGLLNEFALLWAMRERFPLHPIVFKQTACHLPHEANVEQYFSRAGLLTDPNMSPEYLGKLTSIGVNRSVYEPSKEEIKDEYFNRERGEVDIITPKNSPSKGAGSSSDPLPSIDDEMIERTERTDAIQSSICMAHIEHLNILIPGGVAPGSLAAAAQQAAVVPRGPALPA